MTKIGVFGLGNWGTSLAHLWAQDGHSVMGWTIENEVYESMVLEDINKKYLPDVILEGVEASLHLNEVCDASELIVLAVPSGVILSVVDELIPFLRPSHVLVDLAKGIAPEEEGESGLISDAIVAEGETQAKSIWKLRDGVTEAISRSGLSHKFDVTVPPSEIPGFLDQMENLGAEYKGLRTVLFGHLGDGNIHVNMVQRSDLSEDEFFAMGSKLAKRVYEYVAMLNGSISAEHGIGISKRSYLHHSRSAGEISVMSDLKRLFDPYELLNPGVLIPPSD